MHLRHYNYCCSSGDNQELRTYVQQYKYRKLGVVGWMALGC